MNTLRGEISTIVILTTFAVLAVATLVTTTLNKEIQTTETQAAASVCPLLGKPQLISGGKCQVATNESTTLVCALIDPSKPRGDQLVAGQDIPNQPKPQLGTMSWTIANGTGTVQLHKDPAITIDSNKQYRIVVYNWNDPNECVEETDIPESIVASSFTGGGEGETTLDPDPNNPVNAKCKVMGLQIDLDVNKKITLFDVTTPKTPECGPRVAHADSNGRKIQGDVGHIAGPALGSTYWLPGGNDFDKFQSIQFAEGVPQYFYIEMVKTNGEIADEKPFTCEFSGRGEVFCNSMRPGDRITTIPIPTNQPNTAPSATPIPGVSSTPTPNNTLTPLPTAGLAAQAADQNNQYTSYVTLTNEVVLPACNGSGNYDACFKIDSHSL